MPAFVIAFGRYGCGEDSTMGDVLRDSPLGKKTDYTDTYTPSLLCPIPRWDAREMLEWEEAEMPFRGVDFWNCH